MQRWRRLGECGLLMVSTDLHGNGDDFRRLRQHYLDLRRSAGPVYWRLLDESGCRVNHLLAAKKDSGRGKAGPGGGGARKTKSPPGPPSTPSGGPPSGPPAPPPGPSPLPGGGGYQRTNDIGVAEHFARTLG